MLDKQKLVEYINKLIENYTPQQEISMGEFIYASIDHIIEAYSLESDCEGYMRGYSDGEEHGYEVGKAVYN